MKYTIEIIENGLLFETHAYNVNGNGTNITKKEFFRKDSVDDSINFIHKIVESFNLPIGNSYDREVLNYNKTFGDDYILTKNDYANLKKEYSNQIKEYKKRDKKEFINDEQDDYQFGED